MTRCRDILLLSHRRFATGILLTTSLAASATSFSYTESFTGTARANSTTYSSEPIFITLVGDTSQTTSIQASTKSTPPPPTST